MWSLPLEVSILNIYKPVHFDLTLSVHKGYVYTIVVNTWQGTERQFLLSRC